MIDVNHLEKYGLFYFQYGFRSARSIADLLTVVSDGIGRPFNRSGANWAVAPHILLYSECDQTSDLWQQLELAFELKSDLIDTFDQDRKWLVDFNAGKIRLVLFGQSDNSGAIDMEIDESVLEEKSSFKMLGLPVSIKLDWALTVFLLLELPPWQLKL